ncbi:MAG TPA: transglycosylase SLT domain-containing protein [Blastocatellia bacterium]|nr:transglycosylase SLT domain-containing protein [Blastocatellia bacterium]
MRAFAGLLILTFLIMCSADAKAQGASDPTDDPIADDVRPAPQRTPMMIVREAPNPPAAQKPATPPLDHSKKPVQAKTTPAKPGDAAAKPADKAGTQASTQQTSPGAPQPIVIPAAAVQAEMASTGNPKYDEFITQSANRNGVDPNLIVAVMRQESGFNARARSYKGASGLMQLMPATAARFGVNNIFDPQQNIEGGARYLRFLLDTFNGDVNLVLAGYNAGENAVVNSGYKIPRYRETQNYVRAISERYNSTGPGKTTAANKTPVAPSAATFAGGASKSLSNNY